MSYDTWDEIRLDILDRAEEQTGADLSEFYDFVSRAGDRAYHDLLTRHAWLFSRNPRPLMLRLEAPIETQLSSWPLDSYTLTLAAPQAKNLTGWRVLLGDGQQAFPVYEHCPGTAVCTMAAPNFGVSVSGPVTLFKQEYEIADLQGVPPAPLATVSGASGSMPPGTFHYRVTFRNGHGETQGGLPATVSTLNVNSAVGLSAIPTGPPGTLSRRIWRSTVNSYQLRLLTELPDNTTTTYQDVAPDDALVVERMPETNTSGRLRHIVGIWCADANRQIEGPWSEERLREQYADPPSPAWPPYAFSRITDNLIRFSQYPSQAGVVEIAHSYVPRDLSDTIGANEIVLPRNWRWMLSDGGLFYLLDIKHDNRAAVWGARWEKAIEDLKADDDAKRLGIEGSRYLTRKEPVWR